MMMRPRPTTVSTLHTHAQFAIGVQRLSLPVAMNRADVAFGSIPATHVLRVYDAVLTSQTSRRPPIKHGMRGSEDSHSPRIPLQVAINE
jgi:hypothetical protein